VAALTSDNTPNITNYDCSTSLSCNKSAVMSGERWVGADAKGGGYGISEPAVLGRNPSVALWEMAGEVRGPRLGCLHASPGHLLDQEGC
jgi:hypothetical protein